ncbi:MAG: hypothetical protein FJ025_03655 [Chloroflexi bacterium]|nr:hypothetical protein [Chloroflexota bacterium]
MRENDNVGQAMLGKEGEIMPIKWSALKVGEAMDKVELQLSYAQPFINEAVAIIQEARRIPNLAGYMDGRLARVEWDIEGNFKRIHVGVEAVRKAIPEGATEEERNNLKHGAKQSLI